MGDQRSMFRFRLPLMIPSATDQGPEVATQRPSTQAPTASAETQTPAPAQRRPFRFASVGATQPPPPQPQTIATTQTQAPVTQAPSAAVQSIASASTMPIPPPMLPSTSLGEVSVQEPVAQVGPLSNIEAQPSSPSRAVPQSQAPFQPSSPALVSPQAQAAFERSSLALSEPPKSPQTVRQPQPFSPFQTTELTSPPSLPATNAQPSEETGTTPASPPKTSDPLKSSQPPTSSSKALSPVFQKEQSLAVPQPLSLEAQPKTASLTYVPISTSPVKSINQPSVDVIHPSTQSGHREFTAPTPIVAKEISHLPTMKSDDYPKPHTNMDGYHVKTKKEKETEHATTKAHEEPKKNIAAEYATVESGLTEHHKAQPKVDQAVEKYDVEKQETVHAKEVPKIITKQTKSKNSHQKDKSIASGSHHPKVSNGEQVSMQQELRNDIFKLGRKISTAHPEHPIETPISMISLVGENTGASMQLGSEAAERAAVYIHRGHNINPNESANATTDKEESSKGRWSKDTNINKDEVTKTYINNNIQSINNSIVLNASITERNPGIRLAFFHYPAEPIKSNNITESHEIRKAEVSITPPENHPPFSIWDLVTPNQMASTQIL